MANKKKVMKELTDLSRHVAHRLDRHRMGSIYTPRDFDLTTSTLSFNSSSEVLKYIIDTVRNMVTAEVNYEISRDKILFRNFNKGDFNGK